MIPPRSPYGLIQEDLWPNAWAILVASMMLNCTRRKQVEKVLPEFLKRWPNAATFMSAEPESVVELCRPLGFANKRTQNLFRMTERYIASNWDDVRELAGVGQYVARAYEIFCLDMIGSTPPKDHALVKYWTWLTARENK